MILRGVYVKLFYVYIIIYPWLVAINKSKGSDFCEIEVKSSGNITFLSKILVLTYFQSHELFQQFSSYFKWYRD